MCVLRDSATKGGYGVHAPVAHPMGIFVGEASAEEAHEGLRISAIRKGMSAVRATRQRV